MSRLRIRTRLTVLYGALFLIGGALLLGLTYVLVQQNIHQRGTAAVDDLPSDISVTVGGRSYPVADLVRQLQDRQDQIERDTLHSLLTQGSIALGLVTLIGVGVGWLIAERALRPVERITETARRVAGGNLGERIALDGPRDEIKELADTLDSMLERLGQAFDGQRRFAANASHELRTPLTINRTLLEVALGRPDPPPEVVQLGETLLAVNARHERLIDGLLTLVASDQGLTVREPVDLVDITRRVIGRNEAIEAYLGPAPVRGDPVLLERVVQNLVDNALAYNEPEPWVWVSTDEEDGVTYLRVSNDGPMVPQYEVQALFEPFRRLRSRTGSRGTGLGLSIVRSVALAHGGDVKAEPRPNGGLNVTVTLPAEGSRRSVALARGDDVKAEPRPSGGSSAL